MLIQKEEESKGQSTTADSLPPAYEEGPLPPPGVKAANFINILKRMGEVKDVFALDPAQQLPEYLMPAANTKHHLNISTTMGEITAEVFIVGAGGKPVGSDKTAVQVYSSFGTLRLALHASSQRAPIRISASTRFGEVQLLLPRSFRGPLNIITSMGEVTLSDDLRAAATRYGDGKYFVGAWSQEESSGAAWPGDEVEVETRMGTVYLGYDDDAKKNFTAKLRAVSA